jgi:hypothetical protein
MHFVQQKFHNLYQFSGKKICSSPRVRTDNMPQNSPPLDSIRLTTKSFKSKKSISIPDSFFFAIDRPVITMISSSSFFRLFCVVRWHCFPKVILIGFFSTDRFKGFSLFLSSKREMWSENRQQR